MWIVLQCPYGAGVFYWFEDVFDFEEVIEQQNGLALSNGGLPTAINKQSVNYQFTSEDRRNRVNLTPSFISLSTQEYTQWEDFRKEIQFVVKAFESVYKPAFYSRVGLRYEDVISRKKLNLEDRKWSDLIEPHILGIMSGEYEDGIRSFSLVSEFDNGNQTITRARFELVQANNDPEILFLIDCDYYALKKTEKDEMLGIAEKLHTNSTNFIRNAITEELHQAVEPIDIEI